MITCEAQYHLLKSASINLQLAFLLNSIKTQDELFCQCCCLLFSLASCSSLDCNMGFLSFRLLPIHTLFGGPRLCLFIGIFLGCKCPYLGYLWWFYSPILALSLESWDKPRTLEKPRMRRAPIVLGSQERQGSIEEHWRSHLPPAQTRAAQSYKDVISFQWGKGLQTCFPGECFLLRSLLFVQLKWRRK